MSVVETLLEAFARQGVAAQSAARQQAAQTLRARGLPTRHDEDWKYTPLRLLDSLPIAADTPSRVVTAADLQALGAIDGADWPRLVFVDGRFAPQLSRVAALPPGVAVWSAAQDADAALLSAAADDAFDAVNRMLASGGVDVQLTAGARLDAPLVLVLVQTRAGGSHLRHRLRLHAGAHAKVMVQHLALAQTPGYLATDGIRVELGAATRLDWVQLQAQGEGCAHVSQLHVAQGERSAFSLQLLATGAALSRQECTVVQQGAGCETALRAACVLRGSQHGDVHWRVVHAHPQGKSRTHVRSVADDAAHAVFTGRVDVLPGADKTDATMTNRNLLLSAGAEVDTRPQLQIDADDVQCSHGATVGQIDSAALFYLAARGIAPQLARRILVQGFIAQALPDVDPAPLAAAVRRQLALQGLALPNFDFAQVLA
jgi:Fe-S cluster assembly protein SufD